MELVYFEVIERMKDIARLKNDSAVAKALTVTPQALSNYKKRGKLPSHLLIRFARAYGLSVDWLLTGEGQSHKAAMGGVSKAHEDSIKYGKEVAKSMDFAKLSADEIIYIGKLLKTMRDSNKATVAAIKASLDAFVAASEEGNSKAGDGKKIKEG
ncbi:MAG: helix-turn-helix domain-containing protein [Deltaproteobacteria bacterium]|nr:helix-turn-helix domain-containing protein [Deltaproteobacteria bacterium]